jgi:hypothetical protein
VLEEAARLADDVTKLELDRLQMRLDPLTIGRLHRAEQLVAMRIKVLTWGHDDTVAELRT